MVLLSRKIKPFCIFLVMCISGCLVAQKLGIGAKPGRFNHKRHLAEEELECKSCHRGATESAEARMPSLAQCMLCHEGIDEGKPKEEQIRAIFGEKPTWSHVTDLPEDVVFSHKAHGDAKVECAGCHRGIETNTAITKKVRVEKTDCMKCHGPKETAAAKIRSNECDVCHRSITRDWEPNSHNHNWKAFHGGVVRAETGRSEDRCALCHHESSCNACHQDEAPQNHNNQWRHRGHWVAASMDRDKCAVCHRSDFCDRCHMETEPRNHVGAWGSPRNRHCLTCHFPLSKSNCFLCHKDDPSHQAAPERPQDNQHAAATEANCRTCHQVIGLTHLDNGDRCGNCH